MRDIELDADEGRLGEIIDEVLSKMARGETVDVEKYADEHPDVGEVMKHALPALLAVAQSSGETGGRDSAGQSLADSFGGDRTLGDFRLLGELGRGGMGVVYAAEQISLGRQVALKVLPFAGMVRGNALQRFHNEVRAAATLDHPNIVSVYSVGEERGVHYYAMQLIRGQSLAEVIEQLQRLQGDGRSLGRDSISAVLSDAEELAPSVELQPTVQEMQPTDPVGQAVASTIKTTAHDREFYRSVAALGACAADALEHAHQNGVLHRDIKPGNLMLDAESQLYVTDFGLARIESDAAITMTGDLVGTLRYMSPEQALAKRVAIDHRSDIYSLGMTLYELLTLQPAFSGADRQELLKQIAFNEPVRPRALNRSVPPELETIVLKAIEKNPDERYAAAEEMADDLRAFLDDRPIKASPPTPWRRTIKWSRRHPGIVMSATILLLLLGAGLSVSNMLIAEQRNRANKSAVNERAQREEAERQQALAEQNYRDARESVDRYLTTVSQDLLLKQAGMQPLRRELLGLALEYYEGFAERYGDDPSLRGDLVAAYERIADINEDIGSVPEAIQFYERALELRKAIANKGEPRHLSLAAERQSSLAVLIAKEQGDLQRAATLCDESRTMHARAVAAAPDDTGHQLRQALTYNHTGIVLAVQGQRGQAIDYMRRALACFERLSQSRSADERVPSLLAMAYFNVGIEQKTLGKSDDAQANFVRAARAYEELSATASDVHMYRSRRAMALTEISLVYLARGDRRNALEFAQEATGVVQQIANDNPAVLTYQEQLARCVASMGHILKFAGRLEEAAEEYERAISTIGKVVDRVPGNVGPLTSMGEFEVALGATLTDLGRFDDAFQAYHKSIQVTQTLVDKSGLASDRFDLAAGTHNLADLCLNRNNDTTQAKQLFKRAIAIEQDLIREFPETSKYHRILLESSFGLSVAQARSDVDLEQAIESCQTTIEIGERCVRMDPTLIDPHKYLARSRSALSVLYARLNRNTEAERLYRESLETWRRLARRFPDDPRIPFSLAGNLYNMGITLKEIDRSAAARAYREAIDILTELSETHPQIVDPILVHHCWVNYGMLQEAASDKLACYRMAYAAYPDERIVNQNIAGLLTTEVGGELLSAAEALEFATRATKLAPENPVSAYVLGVVQYRNEQWESADKSLRKSLELGDDRKAECLLFLAMAHSRRGHKERAWRLFREAADWVKQASSDNPDLPVIRAEASRLLGVNNDRAE